MLKFALLPAAQPKIPSNCKTYTPLLLKHSNDNVQPPPKILYSKEELELLKLYQSKDADLLSNFILMHPEFEDERLTENLNPKHYLSCEQRDAYLVSATGEIFLDSQEFLLDGEYIFALMPDYRLLCAPAEEIKHHSYLVAGLPVIAIGHAYFSDGRLITLSNNSGHYKPTRIKMLAGLAWFYENAGEFLFEDHSQFDATLKYYNILHFIVNGDLEVLNNPISKKQIIDFITNASPRYHALKTRKTPLVTGYDVDIKDTSDPQQVMKDNNVLLQEYTGLKKEKAHSRFKRFISKAHL